MEKQARDKLGRGAVHGSSSESSPQKEEEEEDMEIPPRHELEENIPLTKTGYTVPASFTKIQVSHWHHVREVEAACYIQSTVLYLVIRNWPNGQFLFLIRPSQRCR